ncbi:MAG: hypothetical protein NVSMB4_13570 [Acidimicrobiales bacterium]
MLFPPQNIPCHSKEPPQEAQVVISCATCGGSFEASKGNARFCGATCRKRGERAKNLALTLPPAPEGAQGVSEPDLVAAVRRELSEADRLTTVAGQVALELAVRVANRREMGSAVASLSKQLREAMAEAMVNVAVEASPLDEIRARRDARRNAG